jgi:hypothetical protein
MSEILGPDGRSATQTIGIIDPTTGLSSTHREVLELLRAWLDDTYVLAYLTSMHPETNQKLHAGLDWSPFAIAELKLRLFAPGNEAGHTEREAARVACAIITNRDMRHALKKRYPKLPKGYLTDLKDRLVRAYYPDNTEHLTRHTPPETEAK